MSNGMIYNLYVGSDQQTRNHLAKVCPGLFMTFPSLKKAAEQVKGMRERYDIVLLVEKKDATKQCPELEWMHETFPRIYMALVTDAPLSSEERKNYLKSGISNLISPKVEVERMEELDRFLNQRKLHKMQAFGQAHKESLTRPFHIPLWKRSFDIVASLGALICLSPLLLITALAIRIESKGPVIYRSKRVGSNYKVFDFLKFRSMYTNADRRLKELSALNQYATSSNEQAFEEIPELKGDETDGMLLIGDDGALTEEAYSESQRNKRENAFVKLERDPRVTRVGRFIRKYSIDELPQLINILKGDMSVVGNRPLPLYEAEQLTVDEDIERFIAPAGLTGLWQVEKRGGSGAMSAAERKQLDVRYAHEFSFKMDLNIIIRTFTAFIQKEDV